MLKFRLLSVVVPIVAVLFPAAAFAQFSDNFESAQEREPECSVPDGFKVFEKRWEDIFYGVAWPNSPSFLTPVGSWSYRDKYARYGKPAAGRILTASFVADDKTHRLGFLSPQPIPAAGYPLGQVALTSTVTFSACRADMYAPCQVSARSGSLFYGQNAALPECRTTPGKTYWITWHNAAPDFSPTTNSCSPTNPSGGVRCDSNFNAR